MKNKFEFELSIGRSTLAGFGIDKYTKGDCVWLKPTGKFDHSKYSKGVFISESQYESYADSVDSGTSLLALLGDKFFGKDFNS